jgi:hypothetical protein
MSRKTILMSAPLGLGGLVLLWAAIAARSAPEAPRPQPAPKTVSAKKAAPVELPPETSGAAPSVAAAPASAPSGGGENALIEERIRKMEERLLSLETKRGTLAGDNRELERQIGEKQAEFSARMMAEWRVRSLEPLLGLSETQKQSLLDFWTKWQKEDAGRVASRDTWLSREQDFRSLLSAEQAAKQHDSAAKTTQAQWNALGHTIGMSVGASKEDQTRFQQTLGDLNPPNAMLLPEAHGADWTGMMREGVNRLQPLLSQDQQAKLGRMFPK